MPEALRFVSYGGGVQSTALLVLAARGRIDYRTFVMANVGDDSEDPRTLDYVRNVATPYAEKHGIELHVLNRRRRDGTVETLWGRLMKERSRSLPIPVRMDNGAPGRRSCTADFKIRVTGRWAREHGATPDNPATVAIGISSDEIMRANRRRTEPHERVVYPLIGIGEETALMMNRSDCLALIRDEGLPVPGKSSCFFCPFHRPAAWEDLHRERPDLFERAVLLERTLNERRAMLGKDRVWLTRFARPLDEAIRSQDTLPLDDSEGQCDSGWCWT